MGYMRVVKKLVPQLQDIDGAIVIINAYDPQFATVGLIQRAIINLPNFVVLNKCDMVGSERLLELTRQINRRALVTASLKTGMGLAKIKLMLGGLPSQRIAVLGIFNSGKTSLINALTGSHGKTDDIPGTTLELTPYNYDSRVLIDTVGQIIDINKPLMVATDLTGCSTTKDKLVKCLEEDASGIKASIPTALRALVDAVNLIKTRVESGNKVIVCGAGASALVAMEIAGQGQETGIPIVVFTNNLSQIQPVAFTKGIAEDEYALADYIVRCVIKGDVLIGVSASGGTGFVFTALDLAQQKGAHTVAITENADTPLGKVADIIIKSDAKPEGPSSSKVQVAHLAIGHALMITLADERGIDAETAIGFMLPKQTRNKKMGIK